MYKFKAQLAEDSPGNPGIECNTKPNLQNQLFPIALLQAILEQKRYDVDVQDVIHHFCWVLSKQDIPSFSSLTMNLLSR